MYPVNHRVCHITTVHSRYDVRIYEKQCLSLAKAGYNVTLIVADSQECELVHGVRIIGVKTPSNRFLRMVYGGLLTFQKAIQVKAQLYHFHDPELIIIGLLLRLLGKKVIYDVHEDVPKDILTKKWIAPSLRYFLSFLVGVLERVSSRYFSAVSVVTREIADRFLQSTESVVPIYNYPKFHLNSCKQPKKRRCKDRSVCYVGGISEIRGIENIVRALPLSKATLNLAGNFESPFYRQQLSQEIGWESVHEHGFIERDRLDSIYQNSCAGIVVFLPVPNHINAIPNKIFEYMAAGLPIIVSHFPGWIEIVDNNNCGIAVDPQNIDDLATAINYLLKNDEEAYQMGQNGYKAVVDKYNWTTEEKKLLCLYNKLLCESK